MLRVVLVALLVAGVAALGSRAARADGWADAKKAFAKAQKSEDWKARSMAFSELSYHDTPEAVAEVLAALAAESHPGVLLSAMRTLSGFGSKAAREAILSALRKGKDPVRLYIILALADQAGTDGKEALLEVLQGRDSAAAAQAAMALGKKQVFEAQAPLLAMLQLKDVRLRAAAARALRLLAGPLAAPQAGASAPPVPKALTTPLVLDALVAALESAQGRDRTDILRTLTRLTGQDFGWDVPAWQSLVAGAKPADIKRAPQPSAFFFGVPVHGRRLVVLADNNVRTEDPHPFSDRARLQAVAEVPGARSVPWFELRTLRHVRDAHAKRVIADLPSGTLFDLILVGGKPRSLFGKLNPANDGTRALAAAALEEAKPEAANDVFAALEAALDIASRKDSVAWDAGPEEILYVIVANPWRSPETDLAVISAAITLKARLRMVPITMVGLGEHPYDLCQGLAEATGGVYVNLVK